MADFWIKVEKSTPDKAEIFEMAALLDIDPDAVLGKLIRVWSWIDSNSEDGHIKSVTHVLIDRVTCCAGFSDAMKNVGWLTDSEIPNFDRHLGENAKKRAKDSERKRKSRDGHKKSVTNVGTESGLDKIEIREDKDKDKDKVISNLPTDGKPPASKKFNDDDVRFAEWFYQGLLNNNPQHKKPNFESNGWSDAVRLMRERDGRTYDQMADMARWTLNDSFWKANVLSPAKLREKWDQLTVKMKQPQQKAKWDNTENLASELTSMFDQKEIYNE